MRVSMNQDPDPNIHCSPYSRDEKRAPILEAPISPKRYTTLSPLKGPQEGGGTLNLNLLTDGQH